MQKDGNYERAIPWYKKGFDIDFRLIGGIEPSWREKLTDNNFDFELIHLRLQKEQYEPEDFAELVGYLKEKYKTEPEKIAAIAQVNAG